MKVEIYNKETAHDPVLRLCLKETDDGVVLTAVTEDGVWEQNLLKIDNGGRVHHYILNSPFVTKYNLATEHDRLEIKD